MQERQVRNISHFFVASVSLRKVRDRHEQTLLARVNTPHEPLIKGPSAMRNRILIAWTLIAATIAMMVTITQIDTGSTTQSAGPETANAVPPSTVEVIEEPVGEPDLASSPQRSQPATPDQVDFVVDPTIAPARPAAEPLDGSTESRPIARLRSTAGIESDIVLDELLVAFTNDDDLDAFLDRWSATVLEADADEVNGLTDYLVRIDPSTAQRDRLAADLVTVEPHHIGTMSASDDTAFSLLAIAGYEIVNYGTEISLNWLNESTSVSTGSTSEDPALDEPDAFNFEWISSASAQQSGIDAAWQLLDKAVGTRIKMMIVDRGFVQNQDFPAVRKIRHGSWGRADDSVCSDGKVCGFHGTDVVIAAMGRADNGFGGAGPASYIADLIAVRRADTARKTFKNIKKVAKEERPHIINMSFGGAITALQGTAERKYGRWMRSVRDDSGALLFAAAGNAGIDVDSGDSLIAPCELEGVVCVGGMGDDGMVSPGSNFGTKQGGGSVEIYGPMCTLGLANPNIPGDGTTERTCGTSVASPVVAGVAAMVRAANPTLGPKEVWQIIKDTAHTRNLGSQIGGGHHRSIDAYRAVATAMGKPYTEPVIEITGPDANGDYKPDDQYQFSATAKNFAGIDLPIQWRHGDGTDINPVPQVEPINLGNLHPGTHVFHAWATDLFGNRVYDTIEIEVANTPPRVSISSPAANTYRYTVEQIVLDGSTRDDDDLGQSLNDGQVTWTVRSQDGGAVVFNSPGHSRTIPANTLAAGDYSVEFSGKDVGGITVSDTTLLTILDVPVGESLPAVTMHSPEVGEAHGVEGGTVPIRLHASASDSQDGVLDGTRMRWIAEQGHTRIVLCEGNDLAEGDGGLATITDCSDVTVQMSIPPLAPDNNRWIVTVEAIDSAGLPGRVTRTLEIHAVAG